MIPINGRHDFSNNRRWRDFVAAVHGSTSMPHSASYPALIGALRTGRLQVNVVAIPEVKNPRGKLPTSA